MLYPKIESSSIGNWLTWMDFAEIGGVRLKQVTHVPTPNEELKLFENAMPPGMVAGIRSES